MRLEYGINQRAAELARVIVTKCDDFRVYCAKSDSGATIIDCGINAPGGLQAGLMMARVCLADLAEVTLVPGPFGISLQVYTDHPVTACMGSQYAGRQVSVGKYFAMGSGPMRAAIGGEDLLEKLEIKEKSTVAVGVLETAKLPDEAAIHHLAEKAGISPENLTLLVAPTACQAGGLQIVARSVETALHKLYELGFDLKKVVSGYGIAPLPPVAGDDFTAIGRTNDAILYGGQTTLWVKCDDDEIEEIGPSVPSCSSKDHGAAFAELFERYDRDFYKIDPMLFSPAEITFCNLTTGRQWRFGRLAPEIIERSFGIQEATTK